MAMAAGDEEAVFHFESTIRGHHVYKTIWTPTVGEALQVVQEPMMPIEVLLAMHLGKSEESCLLF